MAIAVLLLAVFNGGARAGPAAGRRAQAPDAALVLRAAGAEVVDRGDVAHVHLADVGVGAPALDSLIEGLFRSV
jgi:hypothetical protein